MFVGLRCVREASPGAKWYEIFNRTWPHYHKWFTAEGNTARPSYLECRDALAEHMPELVGVYRVLCDLAGGGDVASRFLSGYGPPPFMSGCTQLVWPGAPDTLVRNYDYHPRWFEGSMLYTEWLQPVIAITDCCWGVLDGMNASGLSVSLAFGGRKWSGGGFGIPLVLRYLLETCTTVAEATAVLERLPVHMTYNVALLDRLGDHAAVFVGPGRAAGVLRSRVTANHQETITWPEYAAVTHSVEREHAARALLEANLDGLEPVLDAFLEAPLYSADYHRGFGTLYTSAWSPARGEVCVAWPQARLFQSFERFEERHMVVNLRAPVASRFAR